MNFQCFRHLRNFLILEIYVERRHKNIWIEACLKKTDNGIEQKFLKNIRIPIKNIDNGMFYYNPNYLQVVVLRLISIIYSYRKDYGEQKYIFLLFPSRHHQKKYRADEVWMSEGHLIKNTTFGRVFETRFRYFLFVAKVSFFHLIMKRHVDVFSKLIFVTFFYLCRFPSYQVSRHVVFTFFMFFFPVHN